MKNFSILVFCFSITLGLTAVVNAQCGGSYVTDGDEIPCGSQIPCCAVPDACNGTNYPGCNNYDPDYSETGGCDMSCAGLIGQDDYTLTVEEHAVDMIPGQTTYRVYVDLVNESDFLSSIYGGADVPLSISTTSGFYNSAFGGTTAAAINPAFFAFFPEVEFDSWLTIGIDSQPVGDESDVSSLESSGQPYLSCFAANNTLSGTDVLIDDETGGAWYVLNGSPNGLPNEDMRVLILQITTAGELCGLLNVQIYENGSGLTPLYLNFDFCGPGVYNPSSGESTGCTDESACNYDADATEEDGSCTYAEANYDCAGICLNDNDNDGICDEQEIAGCTDLFACNFSAEATDEDSSCDYLSCSGCTDASACNYDPDVLYNNGSCDYVNTGYDCDGNCLNDFDGDGVCNEFEVFGCTFSVACNYDLQATEDDGSCFFYCPGCTDTAACNFDADAIQDDGTCEYPMDLYGIDYVDCDNNCLLDNDGDGVCDEDEIAGCTDSLACNFSVDATDQLIACVYPEEGYSCEGECLMDSDEDGICDELEVPGCTNPQADNYNADATDDDGSCEFLGCTNSTACNYDPSANVNDNSCEWTSCSGCIYLFACNYDPGAIYSDGSCEFGTCPGCTDIWACNFNPTVSEDDGSCAYSDVCGVCDGPGAIYECGCIEIPDGDCDCNGNVVDALGVCGGSCAGDLDNDGECDPSYPFLNASVYATTDAGTTYRLYAHFENNADECIAMFAVGSDELAPVELELTVSTSFFQHPIALGGADLGSGIQTFLFGMFPDAEYDSWLTIGSTNSADGDVSSIGMAETFQTFNTGTGFTLGGVTGGSWYVIPGANLNAVAGEDGKVLLGQLTVTDDENGDAGILSGTWNMQWRAEGQSTMENRGLEFTTAEYVPPVSGCTDAAACNYNADASEDDGSCVYAEVNYDCDGICLNDNDNDGICDELEIAGCTDSYACNFSAEATDDDGSCEYLLCSGCNDASACNYDPDAVYNDGSCEYSSCVGSDGEGLVSITLEEYVDHTSTGIDELEGFITYRVYANCSDPDDEISAVYGDVTSPLVLTSTDGFYQNTYGEPFGWNINPAFFGFSAAVEYDSWITIGAEDNFAVGTHNWVSLDMASFEAGGDLVIDSENGASMFTIFGETAAQAGADLKVLIAQLTVPLDATITGIFNVQLFVNGIQSQSTQYHGIEFSIGPVIVLGCIFESACNYDSEATMDDGSCEYSSCVGCTDETACNYELNATQENGSCMFAAEGYDCNGVCLNDSDGDQVCDEFEIAGCHDPQACNYDSEATDSGYCDYANTGYDCDGNCLNDSDEDGVCDEFEVAGCTDSSACNYSSEATDDDASCAYSEVGYNCSGGCLLDSDGDQICDQDEVTGCQENSACNYNATATDAGYCDYPETNFDCSGNCLNDLDQDGICDEFEVDGCTDSSACNYDSDATDSDDSCTFATAGYDCDGNCLVDTDGDDICDQNEVTGCQAVSACNYYEAATDAGYCDYPETNYDCDDNCLNDSDNDGICDEFEVAGCTECEACNYDAAATDDDGSCGYAATGFDCDDNCLIDSDGDGICDQNEILGCTDPDALSFHPLATEDDGSCVYCNVEILLDVVMGDYNESGNGYAGVSIIYGYPPFTYYWIGPAGFESNDEDIFGLSSGNYTLNAVDNIGCVAVLSLDIIDYGCDDSEACNYNLAVFGGGSCDYPISNHDCDGNCLNDSDQDGICNEFEVGGCTNSSACNYSSEATDDDGSCGYAEAGYDCSGDCLVDSDGDDICDQDEVVGCQENTACNYDAIATDAGYCDYPETNYDCDGNCLNDSDQDGICDEFEMVGCTDSSACNYDSDATEDDASCTYATAGFDCDGDCLLDSDGDQICDQDEVTGCQDTAACNYDATATDAGYCDYPETNYDCDGNCLNDANQDGICDEDETIIEAIIDAAVDSALEEFLAAVAAGDYCGEGTIWVPEWNECVAVPSCFGDLDNDGNRGTEDLLQLLSVYGTGCPLEFGCTDPTAENYDPFAVYDNGSCIIPVVPCDNLESVNYAGVEYGLLTIGDNCWFDANLYSTEYANGDPIELINSSFNWYQAGAEENPAAIEVVEDVEEGQAYGYFYNAYAVVDSRGICPTDWHVASDEDWMALESYLGMDAAELEILGSRGTDQGEQLKAASTHVPAWDGTDAIDFTAVPAGQRFNFGSFSGFGSTAVFWTNTTQGSATMMSRILDTGSSQIQRTSTGNSFGASIRCIKDTDE